MKKNDGTKKHDKQTTIRNAMLGSISARKSLSTKTRKINRPKLHLRPGERPLRPLEHTKYRPSCINKTKHNPIHIRNTFDEANDKGNRGKQRIQMVYRVRPK